MPITLRVTSFRKDGSPFLNVLTLQPIKDAGGRPRYWVGIHSDASQTSVEAPALRTLRSSLPTTWSDTAQRPAVEELAEMTWREGMIKFSKLLWSMGWQTALSLLLAHPCEAAGSAFGEWLRGQGLTEDAQAVELSMEAAGLDDGPASPPGLHRPSPRLEQLQEGGLLSSSEATAMLREQRDQLVIQLAEQRFPKYVSSKASVASVEKLLASSPDVMDAVSARVCPTYQVRHMPHSY